MSQQQHSSLFLHCSLPPGAQTPWQSSEQCCSLLYMRLNHAAWANHAAGLCHVSPTHPWQQPAPAILIS